MVVRFCPCFHTSHSKSFPTYFRVTVLIFSYFSLSPPRFSPLQIMLIILLTISMLEFVFLKDKIVNPLSSDTFIVGFMFNFLKVGTAVYASLLGEMAMKQEAPKQEELKEGEKPKKVKKPKKLPFVVQKFRFDSCQLLMAILLGITIMNPFANILADTLDIYFNGNGAKHKNVRVDDGWMYALSDIALLKGNKGAGANPSLPVCNMLWGQQVKANFFTTEKSLSNIPFHVEVGGTRLIDPINRFTVADWASFEDRRMEEVLYSGVNSNIFTGKPEDTKMLGPLERSVESKNLHEVVELGVMADRQRFRPELHQTEQNWKAHWDSKYKGEKDAWRKEGAKLNTWANRDTLLTDKSLKPAGQLENHHTNRFRKLGVSKMLLDTKDITRRPYELTTKKATYDKIKEKFSFHIGMHREANPLEEDLKNSNEDAWGFETKFFGKDNLNQKEEKEGEATKEFKYSVIRGGWTHSAIKFFSPTCANVALKYNDMKAWFWEGVRRSLMIGDSLGMDVNSWFEKGIPTVNSARDWFRSENIGKFCFEMLFVYFFHHDLGYSAKADIFLDSFSK